MCAVCVSVYVCMYVRVLFLPVVCSVPFLSLSPMCSLTAHCHPCHVLRVVVRDSRSLIQVDACPRALPRLIQVTCPVF